MRLAVVLAGVCLAVPAGATCPVEALGAPLVRATEAFTSMDVEGFYTSRDAAREALPCQQEPLSPALAVAYHRLEALDAFLGRDHPRVAASFRSLYTLDPEDGLPAEVAIEGHPLFEAWQEAAATPPAATDDAWVPAGSTLYVDGQQGTAVPLGRPVIVQLRDGEGLHGAYLRDVSDAPEWLRFEPPPPPEPPPEPWRPSASLLAASAGTGAVAAGLLGVGLAQRARFMDPQTPFEDLEGHRSRANTFGVAAQVTGGLALGLGAVAFTGVLP